MKRVLALSVATLLLASPIGLAYDYSETTYPSFGIYPIIILAPPNYFLLGPRFETGPVGLSLALDFASETAYFALDSPRYGSIYFALGYMVQRTHDTVNEEDVEGLEGSTFLGLGYRASEVIMIQLNMGFSKATEWEFQPMLSFVLKF